MFTLESIITLWVYPIQLVNVRVANRHYFKCTFNEYSILKLKLEKKSYHLNRALNGFEVVFFEEIFRAILGFIFSAFWGLDLEQVFGYTQCFRM